MSDTALKACGIAVALLVWEALGRWFGTALFAPPTAVAPVLLAMLGQATFLGILATSLQAMLVGYLAAALVAIPLGVAMGRSAWVDAILHPWLSMFIVTSVAAVVPLLILMLGTGFWFRVAVVMMATVWFIMLAVYQGARGIDRRWIDVGRSFGATRTQAFRKVLLPALLPYVLVALRIGLTHAIRAMVVAELFVLVGIGRLLHDAGFDISTARILSLLAVIAAIGIAANALLSLITRWVAPWSAAQEAHAGTAWKRVLPKLQASGLQTGSAS
jgi:ABC-type nitrate/sulfonate/bicarbonate transport system permease component